VSETVEANATGYRPVISGIDAQALNHPIAGGLQLRVDRRGRFGRRPTRLLGYPGKIDAMLGFTFGPWLLLSLRNRR
jgi:hypothetical protein